MTSNSEPLFVDPDLLQRAERVCQQRLETDPDNRAVLRSLADIYRKRGNVGDASTIYARLFRLDPADHEAGYMQAVLAGVEWPTEPAGIHGAPFVLVKDFLPQEFHDSL